MRGEKMNIDKAREIICGIMGEEYRDYIMKRLSRDFAIELAKKMTDPKKNGASRLDPHKEEIFRLIRNGSTKTFIARKFGLSRHALNNWLKKRRD